MVEKGSKKGAVGACNAYVGGPGAAARGRTHFYWRILIQKEVATYNGNAPRSRRGAVEEPSGSTLLGSMGSDRRVFAAQMLGGDAQKYASRPSGKHFFIKNAKSNARG